MPNHHELAQIFEIGGLYIISSVVFNLNDLSCAWVESDRQNGVENATGKAPHIVFKSVCLTIMSAAEKDSTTAGIKGDGTTRVLGSATRNGGGAANGKVNHLPVARERHVLSHQLTTKRYINDRSLDLRAFVAPLEDRVRSAFRYRAPKYKRSVKAQAKVAEIALDIIRQLAHKETGVFNLEAPVTKLLNALFAGAVESTIVTGLARRAQKALIAREAYERDLNSGAEESGRASRGLGYDVARELAELMMLLTWYSRRKMSVAVLEVDGITEISDIDGNGAILGDDRDALFGLEIAHDHQEFGAKGCLISCGLKLLGRDGQALWLRVAANEHGVPVPARPEWSSWTDPGEGAEVELLSDKAPFCSLVPIRPNAQQVVIDELRAFIPYGALQLSSGRRDVDIQISVIDGEGKEILHASRAESICVPSQEISRYPVPAPHSLGIWPHDVVSGDRVSDLTVRSGFKVVAGWERHSISVSFDLSLFMHAGESVMLECRFVSSSGAIVELSSLGMPFVAAESNVAVESLSSYRYRRVLHPRGAWALYQGLCIDIPVEFLLLSAGSHEITCELVVVAEDERILCGDMGRVLVQIPDRDLKRANSDPRDTEESQKRGLSTWDLSGSSIQLESIEIDPSWAFGSDESIRVQANFSPRNSARHLAELAAGRAGELFAPYRVEISLEREDGHVLLQAYTDPLGMSFKPVTRAVCVDGYSGQAVHAVVANFAKDEVLGWSVGADGGRIGAKIRLFARVTALTLAGDVLVSDTKEIFVKPLVTAGRKVVQVREPVPAIIDCIARLNSRGDRISLQTLVNVPSGEEIDREASVALTLCWPGGRRESLGQSVIGKTDGALWTRPVSGLCQYLTKCEYDLRVGEDLSSISVEATLVSRGGEVLSLIRQPMVTGSVLTEADENAADFDSSDPSSAAGETLAHDEFMTQGSSGKSSKGLWGRLFG